LSACHRDENSATLTPTPPDDDKGNIIKTPTTFICDKGDSATSITLTGQWKLVKYHDLKLGTSESQPSHIKRPVIMNFCDNGKIGNMYGQTVANGVDGEYELSVDAKMKTLIFYGTKVWEPNWGSKLWDAMNAANAYERQGRKLFIFFNSGAEKMEFEKTK
jgi:hypothetical protein